MDVFDDPRITAMGLLSEAYAGLMAKLAPGLAALGLSEVDCESLIRLSRSPGKRLRMSDLAAQTGLSTSGITRVVDRLERAGLVRRVACPEDRRSMYAVLTEAGRERMAEVLPGHAEDIERWFTGLLTNEQLDHLLEALRIIRAAVNPGATVGTRPQPTQSTSPVER